MKEQWKRSAMLLLAAIIWGTAFVAQSEGMDYVGGFTFTCIRNFIGSAVLVPCIFLLRKAQGKTDKPHVPLFRNKTLLKAGAVTGFWLCVAANLQQQGIRFTTVGKAGFITALYIVLVPVFGLFLHKKVRPLVWVALAMAVAGLYFLCINEALTIGAGDILLLLCAACFAVQILTIDHYAPVMDCVEMCCVEFFVCGLLSAVPMLLFEEVQLSALLDAAGPILYAGVLSSGVAYTLQAVGQKNLNPTLACMLMSLESVVSVLAGLVILHQQLSGRELLGCCLMFAGVILAQLPEREKKE